MFSDSSSSFRSVSSRKRLAISFTIVTADSGRASASFIHSSILWEKEVMVGFLELVIILEGYSQKQFTVINVSRELFTSLGKSLIDYRVDYRNNHAQYQLLNISQWLRSRNSLQVKCIQSRAGYKLSLDPDEM